MTQEQLSLITELADAFGPSGFEDDVLAVARKWAEDVGTIEEDHLRNLYIYRKENTGSKPVMMLDAHSDEVGFMVHSIRPNGTLRFVQIGGWGLDALASADVLVRNKFGEYIPGIIASRPVHFRKGGSDSKTDISDFSIDIGACSAQEAAESFGVRIGEPVVPATKCRVDEKHGLVFGKAFDCRIGVAAMIETLRQLRGVELPVDVIGVLSAQEEVGERGAKVSVNHARPDVAFCFEGCPADDTFTEPYAIQTAVHKGPMFRFLDKSIICTPRYQRFVLDLAEEKGIPAQGAVREGGGNNGAMINTSLQGVPVVVAGIPVRYIHSMNCITAFDDFESAVALTKEVVLAMTPERIAGF